MTRGAEPCTHPNVDAHLNFVRLEDLGRYIAELQLRCTECRVRFRWVGFDIGMSTKEPMTNGDGFELRAPIEPDPHLTSLMAGDPETGFPGDRA